jgi:hypothetical protein
MWQVEIIVKGHVGREWSDWFSGFEITHAASNSVLTGPVRDQAELRGILSRLANLGLELISVNTLPRPRVPEKRARGGGENKTQKI